jgi:hypothetical protein
MGEKALEVQRPRRRETRAGITKRMEEKSEDILNPEV